MKYDDWRGVENDSDISTQYYYVLRKWNYEYQVVYKRWLYLKKREINTYDLVKKIIKS